MKEQRLLHLALVKIGIPWRDLFDLSEAEAAAYLDAYMRMNKPSE